MPATISSSVGLDVPAEDAPAKLLSFLSDKRIILVLDNCEHLIEAAAVFALQLLRAAPYANSGDQPRAAQRRRRAPPSHAVVGVPARIARSRVLPRHLSTRPFSCS